MLKGDQRKWRGKVGLRKNVMQGGRNTKRMRIIEIRRKFSRRRK